MTINLTWARLADAHDALSEAIMGGIEKGHITPNGLRADRYALAVGARHLLEELIATDHRPADDGLVTIGNAILDGIRTTPYPEDRTT